MSADENRQHEMKRAEQFAPLGSLENPSRIIRT
jgi:hypothetical protein